MILNVRKPVVSGANFKPSRVNMLQSLLNIMARDSLYGSCLETMYTIPYVSKSFVSQDVFRVVSKQYATRFAEYFILRWSIFGFIYEICLGSCLETVNIIGYVRKSVVSRNAL